MTEERIISAQRPEDQDGVRLTFRKNSRHLCLHVTCGDDNQRSRRGSGYIREGDDRSWPGHDDRAMLVPGRGSGA
jgi:hypothetical protein